MSSISQSMKLIFCMGLHIRRNNKLIRKCHVPMAWHDQTYPKYVRIINQRFLKNECRYVNFCIWVGILRNNIYVWPCLTGDLTAIYCNISRKVKYVKWICCMLLQSSLFFYVFSHLLFCSLRSCFVKVIFYKILRK